MDIRAEQREFRERFEEAFPTIGDARKPHGSHMVMATVNEVRRFIAKEKAAERERVMAVVEEVLMGNINAATFAEDTKIFINLIRAKLCATRRGR